MPPSVATTVAVSGPPPPPPVLPKSSENEVVPLQVPGNSGAPPSSGQAVPPLLLPPEPLLEPELELELAPQAHEHCQPPETQLSRAAQGGGQAPQVFAPQAVLVELPLLLLLPPEAETEPLLEPSAQAHCQLPLTHWLFGK
jgi:hypothetical protein